VTNKDDERIAVQGNEIQHLLKAFTEFRDETRDTNKTILKEINKFNQLLSWGKGGIFVITLVGSSLLWAWSQIKDWFK